MNLSNEEKNNSTMNFNLEYNDSKNIVLNEILDSKSIYTPTESSKNEVSKIPSIEFNMNYGHEQLKELSLRFFGKSSDYMIKIYEKNKYKKKKKNAWVTSKKE